MSPIDTVAQLYLQAPSSLFVFCGSQAYGGGIVTRLHTGPIYAIGPPILASLANSALKNENKTNENVGFEVLTAVIMKNAIFCDVTPCNMGELDRRCRGTYFLLHG
jgi:hypothetical protein